MTKPKRPSDIAREHAPLPTEPIGTVATTTGTCKWWRDEKSYGAIATDATAPFDIWCHFSAIDLPDDVFKELAKGQPVEVEYERFDQDSFVYRAIRVRPLGQ